MFEIDKIILKQEKTDIEILNIDLLTNRLIVWDHDPDKGARFALTEDLIFQANGDIIDFSLITIMQTFLFRGTQCIIEDENTPETEHKLNEYLGQDTEIPDSIIN